MDVNIGISEDNRKRSAEALSRLLAGTYVLYIKTHNYHWNVTGTRFSQLHTLFETQYKELFAAGDEIAERIRALGYRAPATFAEFAELSAVSEEMPGRVPQADEMIENLMEGHETICRELRNWLDPVDKGKDEGTITLFGDRLLAHEKSAWMLRACLRAAEQISQPGLKKVASR